VTAAPTPSQTIGPFFGYALPAGGLPDLVPAGTPGALVLTGTVRDGAGAPVPDALLEVWQADAAGRFADTSDELGNAQPAGFTGFGRCPTDADGRFRFVTVRPGPVPGADGASQAPHLDLLVFARGLLKPVLTRVYLPGEPANATDPVLASAGDRASGLVARTVGPDLVFDVHLSGDDETVFFEL
jgi:protocatechuate 3,4-dioxygenase alpha subunit